MKTKWIVLVMKDMKVIQREEFKDEKEARVCFNIAAKLCVMFPEHEALIAESSPHRIEVKERRIK